MYSLILTYLEKSIFFFIALKEDWLKQFNKINLDQQSLFYD